VAITLAMFGIILPVQALKAGQPLGPAGDRAASASARKRIQDVELGVGGTLRGRVVDRQGRPQPNAVVVVRQSTQDLATTTADETGRFVVGGLRGGLHHVLTDGDALVCRSWATHTAPPAATEQVLLVRGDRVERGQMPLGSLLVSDPVLLGIVIAAAIAIPVAVHNAKSDRASGS